MALPPELLARRTIEDRAAKLGVTRATIEADLNRNTAEIRNLLRDVNGTGVPLDLVAQLTHVSRQTLHRWREDGIEDLGTSGSAELAPSPTLRQAIALVVSPRSDGLMAGEIINELGYRGWLPSAPSADQMVRNRLNAMVQRGQLTRNAGKYVTDPAMVADLVSGYAPGDDC